MAPSRQVAVPVPCHGSDAPSTLWLEEPDGPQGAHETTLNGMGMDPELKRYLEGMKRLIYKGFEQVDLRFDQVDEELKRHGERLSNIEDLLQDDDGDNQGVRSPGWRSGELA